MTSRAARGRRREQVKANAAAADWIPAEAELAEIDALVPPPPA